MKKFFVTGASGLLGSHLVKRLVKEGKEVVAQYRSPRSLSRFDPIRDSIELAQLDFSKSANFDSLFSKHGIDVVFHLASAGVPAEFDRHPEVAEVNAVATLNLARAALKHGVQKFVFIGTGFEYRPQNRPYKESAPLEPITLYASTKTAAWMMLDYLHRLEGLPLVTIRPFSFFGPAEWATKLIPHVTVKALKREAIPLSEGTQIRDYLFVTDVVEALLQAGENPESNGKVFNIGGGPSGAHSVREVVESILRLTDAPAALAQYGARTSSRSDPQYFVANPERAMKELQWQPEVSLDEGLIRTIEFYRNTL